MKRPFHSLFDTYFHEWPGVTGTSMMIFMVRYDLHGFLLRAITAILLVACGWGNALAQGELDPEFAERLCTGCHRDKFQAQMTNPHGVLDSAEWRERTGNAPGCLNCHGSVTNHISSGGGRDNVFAFREEPASEKTAVCLDCHSSTHPEFERSEHAEAGLSCNACHNQHVTPAPRALLRAIPNAAVGLERLGGSSKVCVDCHQDELAAFALNERHRLLEGVLECTSCHDPHAPQTRSLLGGFKQEACAGCHRDKGGPFVFEHPASRVDGCAACHDPHGSPNRHLLAHQRVGELCFSCHATVPQFHLGFNPDAPPRFGLDTQCTNCHSAIHGSNFDSRFLR